MKKKDKPKSQLKKHPRCINCNSANIRIGFSPKNKKWFRKCIDCNWVNNYLEELPLGA
jgi:hypothetical protein